MANGSNLKAKIGVDTGDFEKGMKDAKTALRDFEKDGTGALSSITSMFGVSSGAIGDVVKNLKHASSAFSLLGQTGESSAKAMTMGMKALTASIAGLGIMAAVAAFKELNAEASSFEKRLQGVNLAASAKAYRDTYRQAMYEASGAGENWAKFSENIKNGVSKAWTNAATYFFGTEESRPDAEAKAKRAGELASRMVDLKRAQRDVSVEIQAIDNKIAEAQAKFRNNQLSANERKQAEATITELINQKYDKQEYIQKQIVANIKERNSLTKSTEEELDEEANAEKSLLALEGQRQQEKNALLRTSNSISNSMKKQVEAAKELETTLERILGKGLADQLNEAIGAEILANDVAVQRIFNEGDLAMLKNVPAIQGLAERMSVPALIKPEIDTEQAQKAIIELSGIVEAGVVGMSEAIGDLIGNLINGENAWQNFAQAGISVVADMLSTVGQAFIKEGVGVEAAKLALVTGNGVGAIAAGAAMVALAAAMKTTMSNAAANWGGGGYSSSVASSGYSSGAYQPGAVTQQMEVKVTGTLVGEGSKLKAVLNNEDRRTNVTT